MAKKSLGIQFRALCFSNPWNLIFGRVDMDGMMLCPVWKPAYRNSEHLTVTCSWAPHTGQEPSLSFGCSWERWRIQPCGLPFEDGVGALTTLETFREPCLWELSFSREQSCVWESWNPYFFQTPKTGSIFLKSLSISKLEYSQVGLAQW